MKFIDLTGRKFGRLLVIERAENFKSGDARFKCKCDCGNEVIAGSQNLKRGTTKSCGCLQKEVTINRSSIHGMTNTRIFRTWAGMKHRCEDSKNEHYGARGIKVCDEWTNDFMSFYNWSMENGYNDSLTIERIDVNGNYEPSNCKWATIKEQNSNKTNKRLIEFNGKTLSLTQWAEETGIEKDTIFNRLKDGWTVERALTQPIKKQKNNRH